MSEANTVGLETNVMYCGDALETLRTLPDASVNCIVTSPPYFGLRDYGVDGQIGLEQTPAQYVANMTAVFREARRVLVDDGTCWINLGDSYAGNSNGYSGDDRPSNQAGALSSRNNGMRSMAQRNTVVDGLKNKDLMMIPHRVAIALQDDGWYVRSDIIWAKPSCMPESATDRPTRAHEYVFLLTKSPRYWYDAAAIQERAAYAGKTVTLGEKSFSKGQAAGAGIEASGNGKVEYRNARTVWTVSTEPTPFAHFATMPKKLVRRCIVAGCPVGGVVLDPFFGSGTTGLVARAEGRQYVGIELNPEYVALAERRLAQPYTLPMLFADTEAAS